MPNETAPQNRIEFRILSPRGSAMIDATQAILNLSKASIHQLLDDPQSVFNGRNNVVGQELFVAQGSFDFMSYVMDPPPAADARIDDPNGSLLKFFGSRTPSDSELARLRAQHGIVRPQERTYEIVVVRVVRQRITVRVSATSASEAAGRCMDSYLDNPFIQDQSTVEQANIVSIEDTKHAEERRRLDHPRRGAPRG